MNCKPGDMAVVVSGGNEGLVVEVLRVSDYYGMPYWGVLGAWPVKGSFPDGTTAMVRNGSIHDSRLRPIRPDSPAQQVDELEELGV